MALILAQQRTIERLRAQLRDTGLRSVDTGRLLGIGRLMSGKS